MQFRTLNWHSSDRHIGKHRRVRSNHRPRRISGILVAVGCAALFLNLFHATPSNAQIAHNEPQTVELLNGMRYAGRLGSLPGMGPTTANLMADATHHGIVLIDDDMREVFVSRANIANMTPLDRFEEEFEIWQRVHKGDGLGTEIGAILNIGPRPPWL